MPSLVLAACEAANGTFSDTSPASAMKSWAAATVAAQSVPVLVAQGHAVDIVVMGSDQADVDRAIALSTELSEAVEVTIPFVTLHLVTSDSIAAAFLSHQPPNVRLHASNESESAWDVLQGLIPKLNATFMYVATTGWENNDRLFEVVAKLESTGGEIYLLDNRACGSLLIRRSTLIDMAGFDIRHPDPLTEFVGRASQDRRRIICEEEASLDDASPEFTDCFPLGTERDWPDVWTTSRQARRCDVVLPFRDDFDFVRESLDGLLSQQDAEIVIHLVDDASSESADRLFAEYAHCSQIRFYRNRRNLGPFATFNNLTEFAETSFMAVQDADDISLPNRISRSVDLLQVSSADLLGARTELFGEQEIVSDLAHDSVSTDDGESRYFRNSRYPQRSASGYFLENPTLVVRVDSFRALGGYTDFGETSRSRTGVDTDFQLRAYFARANIAVTNDVLVRYRCHGSSATNHAASGFGSQAHAESHKEVRRRLLHYATATFNPRWFGALGQHFGITEKL